MSGISLLTIGLIGWLVYRLLHPRNLEVSPASLVLMWILGMGGVYAIYYVFVGFLQQNPPPVLILALGVGGAVEAIRVQRQVTFSSWDVFLKAKLATVGLLIIVLMMTVSIFMSGFYADTTRMWMAKGDMLNQLPDYVQLMESLPDPRHPDYPMVMSHQYQWQLTWATDWVSLKLSTWVWYIALLFSALALFTRFTKHPLCWLILLAGYPAYWFVVPLATVDVPLSVMWLTAVVWILRYLDRDGGSILTIAIVCGIIVLTKNEGFLIVGSIICGLLVTLLTQPENRPRLMRLFGMIIFASGVSFLSWYALIVPQADITIGSDFALSGFRTELVPQVLQLILPILFNPLQTAGLWLIFLGFIVFGYWRMPVLWLPVLLYLLFISGSYTFSVRPTTLVEHIVQSYFRLLLQITPLALVYVARCFSRE